MPFEAPLPPLGLHQYLFDWSFTPVADVALTLTLTAYLVGVAKVAARHPARPWPWLRTTSFTLGLVTIAFALDSGVGAYDDVLFSDHMVQHLLLLAVAPPLLVLGRPVLLLLHASRNPLHAWTLKVCRSRVTDAVTFPLVGLAGYIAVVVGTHLTRFMDVSLTHPMVHEAEHLMYLGVGYLFFLSVLGGEPIRWRTSFPVQFVLVGAAMTVDAFTGIVLMQTGYVEFPEYGSTQRNWGPSLLDDLHLGGAIMWIGGGSIMAVVMISIVVHAIAGRRQLNPKWVEQARATAIFGGREGVATFKDIDDDQGALDAYNRFLAGLNRHSDSPDTDHR